MKKSRKIFIISVSVLLAILLVIHPIASIVVYEAIFSQRYEPAPWLLMTADDFDSLVLEQVQIYGDGERLAGFKYENPTVSNTHGLVVLAHGLGGGGHTPYLPLIDALTDEGYLVFTYDATGNGESDGKDVSGLPQGPIDLCRAISYALSDTEYKDLPLYLIGHSWGAYSVGAALSYYPEVKGAVMLAGFDSSADMIKAGASDYVGSFLSTALSPTVTLYERIKFGDFASLSVTDGIASVDAPVMVIHSEDDATVPIDIGYDKYYESYKGDTRVTFLRYEDRGHNYLYYSPESAKYRDEINAAYVRYVEDGGLEYSAQTKIDFFGENLDISKCYEIDSELLDKMVTMFKGASGS